MWGIFAGITLWVIVYPMFVEWRQRQLDKKRLADMRQHFSMKHRWDMRCRAGGWTTDIAAALSSSD
jgi:hypothetical protein